MFYAAYGSNHMQRHGLRAVTFRFSLGSIQEHLWRDDAALLRQWIAGETDDCLVHVAEGGKGTILGLTLVRLRPRSIKSRAQFPFGSHCRLEGRRRPRHQRQHGVTVMFAQSLI